MKSAHDLKHQIGLVREALRSEKRRLGFFLGAGCPLGIYDKEGVESIKHIPDVAGLTSAIGSALEAAKNTKELLRCWNKLASACKNEKCPTPNVEHILTQLRTICALRGTANIDGMTAENLRKLDSKICSLIVEFVGKSLPNYKTSYHRFASWVRHLERTYPLEVFTPNYDLLIEEAFEACRVPYFDGFVGAREPFFDLSAMEQDAVPSRWARIWKLHGSINWVSQNESSVIRCYPAQDSQQVMIYPSHLKYDQSRRMPYLAMCDRLKAFFREVNPVLVLCGYSFADDHLNEVILDGLRSNRSAHCIALMYSGLSKHGQAVACANKISNLTLLAWDGAVVGTRTAGYQCVESALAFEGSGIALEKKEGNKDEEDVWMARCCLGDFHHFCLFMETQFGVKSFE